MAAYLIQRSDNGEFLTARYLHWSVDEKDAQRCDLDEAEAIRDWLATLGVRVAISEIRKTESV